jgi:hypothetical protein
LLEHGEVGDTGGVDLECRAAELMRTLRFGRFGVDVRETAVVRSGEHVLGDDLERSVLGGGRGGGGGDERTYDTQPCEPAQGGVAEHGAVPPVGVSGGARGS